tara:strand:- start:692 stop:1564 length:873 start_codon:yes stop_codon:yes gene_type:complete
MSKEIRSALTTIIFLIFIYLISFLGTGIDVKIKTFNAFNYLLGLSVLIQILFFIPSFIFKTEKLYDLIGSSTYLVVLSYAYFSIEDKTITDTLLFIFITTWAVRLGIYLFTRIKRDKEDVRFEKAKKNFFWFLQYWMGQALWVSITSCAAVIAILKNEDNSLNIYLILGSIVWIGGFTIEVIADLQKSKFKKNQDTNSKFISIGLWSKSRHPNYFGEISLWVGIYIMSAPSFSDIEYLSIISPMFVYILLTRMSGINMLEKIADERYGNLLEYQQYKKNTPVLIPYKLNK